MSDPETFASFLNITAAKLPKRPDDEPDPKQIVLNLAVKSKSREIRTEVVSSSDNSKQGSGYNLHLCRYVQTMWRANEAMKRSPSLNRAVQRVESLKIVGLED